MTADDLVAIWGHFVGDGNVHEFNRQLLAYGREQRERVIAEIVIGNRDYTWLPHLVGHLRDMEDS